MKKRREASNEPPSAVYELRLADGTPGEAFARLAQAIDAGKVTIGEAKLIADILERRLRVLDAEKFRQRLELAEATAREAQRRAALPPARASVVDVTPEPKP
jgi:hypothetical protein